MPVQSLAARRRNKIASRKLADAFLVLQRKKWERKIDIYPSLCSGLMMEVFHRRDTDSAENVHDSFIQLFLLPDQFLAPLK